jgi:hypothetical protein
MKIEDHGMNQRIDTTYTLYNTVHIQIEFSSTDARRGYVN